MRQKRMTGPEGEGVFRGRCDLVLNGLSSRLLFLAGCAVLWVALGAGPLNAQSALPPVRVLSCKVVSQPGTASIEITYRNVSPTDVTSIDWRARYGSGWIDFADAGPVAAGASTSRRLTVKNHSIGEEYYSFGRDDCAAISVRIKDGATWTLPGVPGDTMIKV
jgi:hypothetical protein